MHFCIVRSPNIETKARDCFYSDKDGNSAVEVCSDLLNYLGLEQNQLRLGENFQMHVFSKKHTFRMNLSAILHGSQSITWSFRLYLKHCVVLDVFKQSIKI